MKASSSETALASVPPDATHLVLAAPQLVAAGLVKNTVDLGHGGTANPPEIKTGAVFQKRNIYDCCIILSYIFINLDRILCG